jgi:hypothetical protein|tara:strand:+ start:1667 stop:1945 length:279 start_codon:yes stop_codon:yes gene_type:complete
MYNKNSPYAKTYVVGDYLDVMTPRVVIQDSNDETYTIESQYHMRPDLLAYQKYGSSKYWWMFAIRNKDTLIDPIQDFKAGTTIKIPKIENLR